MPTTQRISGASILITSSGLGEPLAVSGFPAAVPWCMGARRATVGAGVRPSTVQEREAGRSSVLVGQAEGVERRPLPASHFGRVPQRISLPRSQYTRCGAGAADFTIGVGRKNDALF